MRGTLDKRMTIARLVQSGPPKGAPLKRGSEAPAARHSADVIRANRSDGASRPRNQVPLIARDDSGT